MKMLYNDYDVGDMVIHLHKELEQGGFLGQPLQYVYVDEVQDLTQAQIALLKYICPNVLDGFMFAGDTAQTILRGVGFRFEDIRNLFYLEFLGKRDCSGLENRGKVVSGSASTRSPDIHYLTRNFRTHVGILKLANSVVQHIYQFFPESIDKLDPETSLIQGETPLFLQLEGSHDLVTALFNRDRLVETGYEFGAEQAILVRDESTKTSILTSLARLNKSCLVPTLEECKGLEFQVSVFRVLDAVFTLSLASTTLLTTFNLLQDVLIYNFFADSKLDRKWRVVTR